MQCLYGDFLSILPFRLAEDWGEKWVGVLCWQLYKTTNNSLKSVGHFGPGWMAFSPVLHLLTSYGEGTRKKRNFAKYVSPDIDTCLKLRITFGVAYIWCTDYVKLYTNYVWALWITQVYGYILILSKYCQIPLAGRVKGLWWV